MSNPIHWDDEIEAKLQRMYASCRTAPFTNVQILAQHLDTHLVIPLLQTVAEKNAETPTFKSEDLVKAQMDVISKTKMVEYEFEFYQQLNAGAEMPAEMAERKEAVLADWMAYQGAVGPLLPIVEAEDGKTAPMVGMKARGEFTAAFLLANNDISADNIEALYHWAKFRFECGNYAEALGYLEAFRDLSPGGVTDTLGLSALWGKFAAEMLLGKWDEATQDMTRIRETIDTRNSAPPLDQLQQRTWLMHWSLFVVFQTPEGQDQIVDMFLDDERYLNAITTNCPHMLRYLATAVITNKRRKTHMANLVKVIQTCKYMYTDPITEFVEALYVDFDFEGAQKKLEECKTVLAQDFFLGSSVDDFVQNARQFIFETYCRIHQTIDINMLSKQLGMSLAEAERWIVDLVREARLDAKIDAEANHVLMGVDTPDVYQQVIDKTKSLAIRSYVLGKQLEGKSGGGGQYYDDSKYTQQQQQGRPAPPPDRGPPERS